MSIIGNIEDQLFLISGIPVMRSALIRILTRGRGRKVIPTRRGGSGTIISKTSEQEIQGTALHFGLEWQKGLRYRQWKDIVQKMEHILSGGDWVIVLAFWIWEWMEDGHTKPVSQVRESKGSIG